MPTLSEMATVGPAPRKAGWGTLADVLNYIDQNILKRQFGYSNPVTGAISQSVGIPAAARVANDLSYGYSVTGLSQANVPLIPQDTAEAIGLAVPVVGQTGKFYGKQVARLVDQAITEGTGPLARLMSPTVARMMPSEYGMVHRPPTIEQGAAPLHDLTKAFDETIYSNKAVQNYGTGEPRLDKEVVNILQKLRGRPDAEVTIYRAVPKDVTQNKMNSGDWVTLSREYAMRHGESTLKGDYKILSQKVPAKHLTTNADSILEQGYYP